jgi:3-methyladenine DNA glycosylase AlkD
VELSKKMKKINSKKTQEIIKQLNSLANSKNVESMAKFGIRPKTKVLGISIPELRKIAKDTKKKIPDGKIRHQIAQKLWEAKIHEARHLAAFIDEPKLVTEKQIEKWVADFDSWDIVDQVISNLFDKTEFAYKKAFEWSKRKEEFVKRSAFTTMAALSVHDKKISNEKLKKFFPIIKRESLDERNFVKKAVNWALRQIGKRNWNLNQEAIKLAKEIEKIDSKAAKWIAKDALRELQNPKVQKRLKN